MRRAFDVQMLSCHCASCANLTLFFAFASPNAFSLAFEVLLLVIKSGLEINLGALTPDLVVHHAGMAAAAAGAVAFPSHSSSVLFVNVIHIPLAVQYTRRLRGGSRGGVLDWWFATSWLFVVGARCAMMLAQSLRTGALGLAVRWPFFLLTPVLVALDVQWTRETFDKRTLPTGWPLLLSLGALAGAFFESGPATAVWAAASAASLLLVLGSALSGQLSSRASEQDACEDERVATTD